MVACSQKMSSMSPRLSATTTCPRWGSSCTMPSPRRVRSASRTGVMLTPSAAAVSSSRMNVPGRSVPVMMSARRRAATSSESCSRRTALRRCGRGLAGAFIALSGPSGLGLSPSRRGHSVTGATQCLIKYQRSATRPMEHQPLTEASPTEQPYLARRQNWTNQLARHALMQPNATALRFLGHTTTWGELDRRVTALAGSLSRRGVGFGDRVLILMLNRTEFIESFLAANKLGAIAVPVNFRMTPPEIAFLVSDCQARVVITEAVLATVATAVRGIDPTLETVVVAGGGTDDEVIGYDDLISEPGDAPQPVDIPNDSPALIMYTSGTTGRPKGAVLTHNNIAGQAMTNLFTVSPDINHDVGFIGVPLFHIAGIGNIISGLLLGLPTVVYPVGAFDPGALLDVLEAEGVSSIFLVPAQWQAVCAAQKANPRQLRLRVLSWGAAPASDTLLREMAETFPGAQILAAFGQTEMSPVTCMLLG